MRSRCWWLILAGLWCGDVLFIALHLVHLQTSWLPSDRWSIARDHGYVEMFQYLKYVAICLSLGQLFVRTHLRVMLGWVAVFAFLLLDDAGRMHERFGLLFAAVTHLPDMGELRARDIGELVFALLAGLIEDGGEMFVLSLACAYTIQRVIGPVQFRPAKLLGL
jgi:hypothetical protein